MQTVGKYKTDDERADFEHQSSSGCSGQNRIFLADSDTAFLNDCDYIVDAIDTISAKLALVQTAHEKKIPIISSMGTGNKLIPHNLKLRIFIEHQSVRCAE